MLNAKHYYSATTRASGEAVTRQGNNVTSETSETDKKAISFPDRSTLRASLPPSTETASEAIRAVRAERQAESSQSGK